MMLGRLQLGAQMLIGASRAAALWQPVGERALRLPCLGQQPFGTTLCVSGNIPASLTGG